MADDSAPSLGKKTASKRKIANAKGQPWTFPKNTLEHAIRIAKAIEEKQVAEQQALMAQRQLVRVKIEAEQQLTRARAEAEGLRLQREAVSGPLVELRRIETQSAAIEKWNGHLPRVILGQNQSLVDVSKFTQVSK